LRSNTNKIILEVLNMSISHISPSRWYYGLGKSQAVFKGKVYSTGEILSDINIEVKNKTDGSRALIYSPLKTTYSLGGRTGESMRAFKIGQPGVYQISASYARGDSSPEVVLAVGKSFSDGSKMWNNAMLYLASIILGMGVIILTTSKLSIFSC
jgi:hypothetical protein